MPKITQVESQKRNPHRFNIFLDGLFAFGADADTVVNYRLVVGKEILTEELPQILFETELGELMDRIYSLFARRQRSEKEIRDYLKNLSFKRKVKGSGELSSLVIEQLVERLKQKGMIDDHQFAQAWVESRRKNKQKGAQLLKAELFQKGIDREIVEEVLSNQSTETKDKDLAKIALEKKLKGWRKLSELEFKKKAVEFLVRRGFGYPLAKDIVDDFLKK